MQNLKPGDILTKDGDEVKVIAVSLDRILGDCVWTTMENSIYPLGFINLIETLIKNGWTKKEEPWMPKMKEGYWCIIAQGVVLCSNWNNDSTDKDRASFLGIFPTEEAATKRRDEIKKLIRK